MVSNKKFLSRIVNIALIFYLSTLKMKIQHAKNQFKFASLEDWHTVFINTSILIYR